MRFSIASSRVTRPDRMRAYNQFRAEGSTGRQGVPILITSAISVSARQTVLTDVKSAWS